MNRNDQEFLVQNIRAQYLEKEEKSIDQLRELDAKVKRPANILAYCLGSVAALVMGSGMSLVMTDVGKSIGVENPMMPGIAIGIVGILMAVANYPIYKKFLGMRKKQYANKIIALSDKIMNVER